MQDHGHEKSTHGSMSYKDHSHKKIQSGSMSQYTSGRHLAQMRVQYGLQSTHQ
jgi:hypothetical protein